MHTSNRHAYKSIDVHEWWWGDVVGQFNMGGHRREALESPQRPGRRYLSGVANSKKYKVKTRTSKTTKKTHEQRETKLNQQQRAGKLRNISQQTKKAEQNEVETHGTS